MTPVNRLHALATLRERYEAQVGRPATPEEIAGIRRAHDRHDNITAKLALGVVMGQNTDWPKAHRREALRAYDLSEDLA